MLGCVEVFLKYIFYTYGKNECVAGTLPGLETEDPLQQTFPGWGLVDLQETFHPATPSPTPLDKCHCQCYRFVLLGCFCCIFLNLNLFFLYLLLENDLFLLWNKIADGSN